MIHPDDKPLNDTQIDTLDEWLGSEIRRMSSVRDAVRNSNSSGLRVAEQMFDKRNDPPLRPRCYKCNSSNNIRLINEAFTYGGDIPVCRKCYDETPREADEQHFSFSSLDLAGAAV